MPHHRINKNQQWHRKAALFSFNTIAINMMCIDRVEYNAHSLYDLYGHALHKTPSPVSNEIYNLGRPFLGHNCFILTLSDPPSSIDKKRRRNIACALYHHAPAQEPLHRG